MIVLASFGLVAVGGCHRPAPGPAAAAPPVLPVSKPVQRLVTNFVDFTGRTSAVEAVDVRPRHDRHRHTDGRRSRCDFQ